VPSQRENGIAVGLVSSLDDPEGLGRVKVTYPHLGDVKSDWAWLVSLMAGPDRGAFFRPEPGDQVVVGLEHGDPRRPYVLGAVWSKTDKPPKDDGKGTDNNWRFFKSRSGHLVVMDDTSGAERIQIVDKDGSRKVVIDSAGDKVQVTCDGGQIEVNAGTGTVSVEAKTVRIKSTGTMELEATGNLTIKGATVSING
jgi:uncharacterized protein involved in type VI secretion and phage assembly